MSEQQPNSTPEPKESRQVDVGGHIGSVRLLDNGAPRYELRIDREGRWFHEGVEIVREDIRNLFSRHLILRADGAYCIKIGRDECPVIVEDAPFIVVRVTRGAVAEDSEGRLALLLNDGGIEPLDARTITVAESNTPYCRVRGGLAARFSRPAYYQLAEFIEYDEPHDRFHLVMEGESIELKIHGMEADNT